jgi:N-acetylmuramoyl-L-alanine amidase
MTKLILTTIVLCLFTVVYGGDNNHAVAKVKKGENVEKLLKRHLLTPHNCNLETFRSLNGLNAKFKIIAGKVYKLPLIIVPYNGKNIRSSTGIKDMATAKKIEKLNSDLLKVGIRDQHFKSSKKIWVPIAEFDCDYGTVSEDNNVESRGKTLTPSLPVKETTEELSNLNYTPTGTELKRKGIKTIHVPLMGKGYDIVHIEDYSLSGHVFYIISGHGGPDPGAVCTDCPEQMCEDEYAYDVALRLARNLMQHGATVEMIVQDENDGIRDDEYLKCDRDEQTLGKYMIPLGQKKRLQDRAATVNSLYRKYKKKGYKVHKAIEIHVDSRSKNTRQDVFFYYNKNSAKSKKLAETVQEVFSSKYDKHQKGRGYHGYVEDRGIYMVRNVAPTMLFVELANIRNTADQARLIKNTNRQALANWLFEGLRK